MNTGKTEFILFDSWQNLFKCKTQEIIVVTDKVAKSNCVRLLGAWMDLELSFNDHVTKKCKSAMWNLMKLKCIRSYLDMDTAKILVDALVTSHLAYCNSLLVSCCDYVIKKVQRV